MTSSSDHTGVSQDFGKGKIRAQPLLHGGFRCLDGSYHLIKARYTCNNQKAHCPRDGRAKKEPIAGNAKPYYPADPQPIHFSFPLPKVNLPHA